MVLFPRSDSAWAERCLLNVVLCKAEADFDPLRHERV
jgi:hypothetical protein